MKKFFGGLFIGNEILRKEGIYHPIKLDYYKIINQNNNKEEKLKYGVEIEKTEYYTNDVKIEKKAIQEITNDEIIIERILNTLKENLVTPTGMEDVIKEIFSKRLQIVKN